MKKIFADLAIVFVVFITVNVLVRIVWIHYIPNHCVSSYDNKIHTVVVGSSMTECAINDTILDTYINLSHSAVFYCANYGSIRWANEYTNIDVDTIICCAGIPSFFAFENGNMLNNDAGLMHVTESYSLIVYRDFLKHFILKKGCLGTLSEPLQIKDFKMSRLGGAYVHLERFKLKQVLNSQHHFKDMEDKYGKYGYDENAIRQNSNTQVVFLQIIKNYCDRNGIVLVLMNTPSYHLSDFIDDTSYRLFIKNTFGKDQLIADYSDFKFPNDSCWGDLTHLNYIGAEYFSNYIKEHGLDLITAEEYCERKK